MYPHEREALKRIKASLRELFHEDIVSVYAFGSRVRGDHADWSDFDVLVVVKSKNRSYYAILNAARALLILDGANPESYNGIVTMLSLRSVKPALLPVRIIKDFKVLLSRRTDVDYGDFETIDASDAEDSLRIPNDMIVELDRLRKEMIESL